jgi:hypothetical protein
MMPAGVALRRCRMRARSLLCEPTIPLHHRIKTLLLLASIVGKSSVILPLSYLIAHYVKLVLLLTRIIEDIDGASAFLQRAQAQWVVAHNHEAKNDHNNAEAEEALVELDGTIKEVRSVLAEEEEEEEDAGAAKEALVEDEDMKSDDDHPAPPGPVQKKLALRQTGDSKQATAVKPDVVRALS